MIIYDIYTDGGAINNPGPAGIGIIIKKRSDTQKAEAILTISEYIGEATNNQAEYRALIRAMQELLCWKNAAEQNQKEVLYRFFLDSELLVNQLNLKYKVKNRELQPLFLSAHNLAVSLGAVRFEHIPREQNQEADKLVKAAIKKR